VEIDPDGEREEVRQIFESKGFSGDELGKIVTLITADRAGWVRTMLTEEYGLPREVRSPWLAAIATFSAFLVCGLVPLLPYLFGLSSALKTSMVMTAIVFFAIGSIKSQWSTAVWWRSGLSTLALGAVAAGLAYGVGQLLNNLTPQ